MEDGLHQNLSFAFPKMHQGCECEVAGSNEESLYKVKAFSIQKKDMWVLS